MSFSAQVKEELVERCPAARHCRIAEFAAIFGMCGRLVWSRGGKVFLKIHTENLTVAQKSFILIKKAFRAHIDVRSRSGGERRGTTYTLLVKNQERVQVILKSLKLMDDAGVVWGSDGGVNHLIIQNTCCKRAYLRGAFLASGSITDPEKAYHLEIVASDKEKITDLQKTVCALGVEAKVVQRKKYHVLYVKEGSQIVDVLNNMEAYKALMDFENVRIVKEVRNAVNRKVNCETANISKTVNAATKQSEDIRYIHDVMGFDILTDGLRQMAELRLQYPEASLQELGQMLPEPISKSGVNHRLRKLSAIAQDHRSKKEDIGNDFKNDEH